MFPSAAAAAAANFHQHQRPDLETAAELSSKQQFRADNYVFSISCDTAVQNGVLEFDFSSLLGIRWWKFAAAAAAADGNI